MNIFTCWLDVMYQLRSSVCATRISLGLTINAGMLLAESKDTHLRWTRDRPRVNWEEFVLYQVRANETYSEDKRQFNDRNRMFL